MCMVRVLIDKVSLSENMPSGSILSYPEEAENETQLYLKGNIEKNVHQQQQQPTQSMHNAATNAVANTNVIQDRDGADRLYKEATNTLTAGGG